MLWLLALEAFILPSPKHNPPPQSSATPTPIPIEGIPSLQTWVTRFAQWAEENRVFFKASPAELPPPPPDLNNVIPIMWGVPIPPQCPSPSQPLPTPSSIHGGLSWSTARGFPSPSPKLGKSLAAKPDSYDGNKTQFVQWRRTVNLYLSSFEMDLTDWQKMLIILSYMKGDNAAGRFADLMVTTRGIDTMSFTSFEEKLKKTFQPATLVRNAETAFFALKQGKESIEDYFTWLYQLAKEAKFSVTYHSRMIVNLIWRAVKLEIVEFVEQNQPDLIDSTNPQVWEMALVRAEEILNQITKRKQSIYTTGPTYNPCFVPRTQTQQPQQSYPPPTGPPPLSSPVTSSTPHPNQPGVFPSCGAPMELGKVQAVGICWVCKKPWPCPDHPPHPRRQICSVTFNEQEISRDMFGALRAIMDQAEKDSTQFSPDIVQDPGFSVCIVDTIRSAVPIKSLPSNNKYAVLDNDETETESIQVNLPMPQIKILPHPKKTLKFDPSVKTNDSPTSLLIIPSPPNPRKKEMSSYSWKNMVDPWSINWMKQ